MFPSEIIVYAVFVYSAVGCIFALYFSFFAVRKYDESAKDAGIGFSLIIFFGVTAFWPLFLSRLLSGKGQPTESTEHRQRAEEK